MIITRIIGLHNGALAADNDNNADGVHSASPSRHTKEFCDGYSAGYSDEGYLLTLRILARYSVLLSSGAPLLHIRVIL
jgi:hypothetical protein